MNDVIIAPATHCDSKALDELLWRVLWRPLGLPRDVRRAFKLEGEEVELVAKQKRRIVGGLVAVWTRSTEVDLRHLAVCVEAQGCGLGINLVAELDRVCMRRGVRRVCTIARHTSVAFFGKLGFTKAQGTVPDHPLFAQHGIKFEIMEKIIEPAGAVVQEGGLCSSSLPVREIGLEGL